MAAPVGNTCPIINDIIKNIEYAIDEVRSYTTEEDITWCIDYLKSAKADLEVVRDHNAQLREWGEENEEKLEKIQEIL